ncbi:MAG: SpoIID/LytB domain-containing protein [Candidatus Krumholzibacteria bacterium]
MRVRVLACCGLLLVGLCTIASWRAEAAGAGGTEPDIRVLLAEGQREVVLTSSKGFSVQTTGGLIILEVPGDATARVTASYPSVNVVVSPANTVGAVEGEAVIVPKQNSEIVYGEIPYAGVIRVALEGAAGGLTVRNFVPLETYLQGVLPHEIGNPGADAYDALKAQAVAARTYAVDKMHERRGGTFDVYASVQDQVYRGRKGTFRVATAAVRDTRGRTLQHRGETAKTYYSACCGGHTSDIRLVWPAREAKDYLHGVLDRARTERGAFCRENKYFRWRYSFTGMEMGEILRVTLPRELGISENEVGALKNMRVETRSASGRVITLSIETTKNTFTIEGDRIRWVLMVDVSKGRILPSVMFRLDKAMERDRISFVSLAGGGNGHGVGMCQNGAIAMANRGYTYQMILTHYYPGCTVEKMY